MYQFYEVLISSCIDYICGLVFQVDAMKVGVKEFKKEYKNVNIDNIEVCEHEI
jgi:hypothetical protein